MKIVCSLSQEDSNFPGEDRFCCRVQENIYAFAVFDGHGGSLASETACRVLLDKIISKIALVIRDLPIHSMERKNSIFEIFCASFDHCDEEIFNLEKARLSKADVNITKASTCGACAVVAVIVDGELFVANVGDCEAVLLAEDEINNITTRCSSASTDIECNAALESYKKAKFEESYTVELSPSADSAEFVGSIQHIEDRIITDCSYKANISAIKVTELHNCGNIDEVEKVHRRTFDPNPFRTGKSDEKKGLTTKRVAGSLAITRALGDGYLKREDLSDYPYKKFVPYITNQPHLYHRILNNKEIGLLMATDGMWEWLSDAEVLEEWEALYKGDSSEKRIKKLLKRHINPGSRICSCCNCGGVTVRLNNSEFGEVYLENANLVREARNARVVEHEVGTIDDFACSPPDTDSEPIGEILCSTISATPVVMARAPIRNHLKSFTEKLLEKVMKKVAIEQKISVAKLKKINPGRNRRCLVDDITIMFLEFAPDSL